MPVKTRSSKPSKSVARPKSAVNKRTGGAVKKRKVPVRRGGAVKPSAVLGAIGAAAGGASLIIPNPVTPIISGIASIGSAIAGLFGGALMPSETRAIMQIHANVQARKKR